MNEQTTRPRRKRSLLYSVVLPLIAFVSVICGIAWLAQNVPNWGQTKKTPEVVQKHLVFTKTAFLGEPNPDSKMNKEAATLRIKEFVVGSSGQFDFEFGNTAKSSGQLGVGYISCQCSNVQVAIFNRTQWQSMKDKNQKPGKDDWKSLEISDRSGYEIPAGWMGIVRVAWTDRTLEPKIEDLLVTIWFQLHGQSDRQLVKLAARLRLVPPIRFDAKKLDFDAIDEFGRRTKELICWSPFHEKMDLQVVAGTPSDRDFFEVEIVDLSPAAHKNLKDKLQSEGDSTTIKFAASVRITCHAKRSFAGNKTKYMTLGPFQHALTVKANGVSYVKTAPILTGQISGPLTVGDVRDRGRIRLEPFSAAEGTSKRILITGRAGVDISVVKILPDFVAEQKWLIISKPQKHEQFTENRPRWWLDVAVAPGKAIGGRDLPDECAIVLQINSTPPRQIRVPIIGYAKRR